MELNYREFLELESLLANRIEYINKLIPNFSLPYLIKSYKKDVRILKGLIAKLEKEVK